MANETVYKVLASFEGKLPNTAKAECRPEDLDGIRCPDTCYSRDGGNNCVEVEITGPRALFSDVTNSGSGEKCSYPIPTYEALRRILGRVYQKPTFNWVIDELRVMNQVHLAIEGHNHTNTYGNYEKGNNHTLVGNLLLCNVRYQVRAHIEWNYNHVECADDRCYCKHLSIFKRALEKGPRRSPCLGVSELLAEVKPCKFGSGEGYYDNAGEQVYGFMYHSMTYCDEALLDDERGYVTKNFWSPIMVNGVLKFCRPQECPRRIRIAKGRVKAFEKVVCVPADAEGKNVVYKRVVNNNNPEVQAIYDAMKREGLPK